MKAFLVFMWKIWIISLSIIYILTVGLFIVLPLSYFDNTFRYAYPLVRYWGKFVFYFTGFTLDYKINALLDKNKNYIFIANHSSAMDIMLVFTVIKDHPIAFVGMAELLKIPIFGQIFKKFSIPVDRNHSQSRANVYKEAKKKFERGISIFIFPEGGVSDNKEYETYLDPFKNGAFNIAIETKTPIVVIGIQGLNKMFPFHWLRGYPGRVKASLLTVLETNNLETEKDKEQLKKTAYDVLLDYLRS